MQDESQYAENQTGGFALPQYYEVTGAIGVELCNKGSRRRVSAKLPAADILLSYGDGHRVRSAFFIGLVPRINYPELVLSNVAGQWMVNPDAFGHRKIPIGLRSPFGEELVVEHSLAAGRGWLYLYVQCPSLAFS